MKRNVDKKADITFRQVKKEFEYNSIVVLTLDISYPEIRLEQNPRIESLINKQYQSEVKSFYNYAANKLFNDAVIYYRNARQNNFPFHPFDAVMRYTVTLNENCYLSTYGDRYEFTGGAHGMTVRFSDSWDLRTGRHLQMRDLFRRGQDYRNLVLEQIVLIADKNIQANPYIYFENYRELIVKNFNPKSFYLKPHALSVYYQQYEIGPYASGIIVFDIPYESLGIERPHC
jgi:hypothetical protein